MADNKSSTPASNAPAADTSNAGAGEAAKTEKAAPKEIIRGRMPVAVVHMVRFGSKAGESTKAKADMFGTTVGKVDDIAKNRNFAYVGKDFVPTEAQKADAIAWLERHPGGKPEALIAELKALPVATAEQSAAFETARTAARGQSTTKADGTPADAGGGNRKAGAEKGKAAPAASGEALLK